MKTETLTKEQNDNYNLMLDIIKNLSHCQGFYGRLLNEIQNLSETELHDFIISLPKFKNPVDVIFYFET